MKRFFAILAVTVLVLAMLGACGKSEEVNFEKISVPAQETTANTETTEKVPESAGVTKTEETNDQTKTEEMTTTQQEPQENPSDTQASDTNNEWFTPVLNANVLSQSSVSLNWNDPNGKTVNFKDRGAKLYLIDVWAQWCPPCRASTPTMISLYNKYKANGLMVIGLNVDAPDAIYKAQEFAQSEGIQYPVVNDPQSSKIGGIFVGQGIPAFTLVDAEGNVLFQNEGAITEGSAEANNLESIIRSKLGL